MWVKRFIYFHNVRHPAEMAESEINAFLTHLAVEKHVSASTQNQAGRPSSCRRFHLTESLQTGREAIWHDQAGYLPYTSSLVCHSSS